MRRWATLFVVCAQASACERAPCSGLHAPSRDPHAPHLVQLSQWSQDPVDPWLITFEVLFVAPDGNASDGSLDVYVGTGAAVRLPLKSYFGPSGVPLNATSGRLAVPWHFASGIIQDDTTLRIGAQLVDADARYSNCYSIDLHFDIDSL